MSLDIQDQYGWTLLHWASAWKYADIIKLLLQKGANPNTTDYIYQTSLDINLKLFISDYNWKDLSILEDRITKILKQAGGQRNIYSQLKDTIEKGDEVRLQRLLKRKDANPFLYGDELIHSTKKKEIKKILIQAKSSKKKEYLTFSFFQAIRKGDYDAVDFLIKKGLDLETKMIFRFKKHGYGYFNLRGNLSDVSPLHYACKLGHLKIAELLITKGADINSRMKGLELDGATPLHRIVVSPRVYDKKKLPMVRLLLKKGADLEAQIKRGRYKGATPLHLLAHNTGPIYYSRRWMSPEDKAMTKQANKVVHLLIEKGADINAQLQSKDYKGARPIDLAIERENLELVKYFISKGAKLDSESELASSPIIWALNSGYTDIVELIIKKGANVNVKDLYKRTPLHMAASLGYIKIAKLLLKKGAKVNVKDKNGLTPLDLAKKDTMKRLLAKAGGKRHKWLYSFMRTFFNF